MNDELLAKSTGETLLQHTLAVVGAVRQVVENLPDGVFDKTGLLSELILCAAFHDTGKAASGFQEVLRGSRVRWDGKRHEILSAAFAANCEQLPDESRLAILTHHRTLPPDGTAGRPAGALPSEQLPDEDTAVWSQMVREFDANRVPFTKFWEEVCKAIGRPDLIELANKPLANLGLDAAWLKRGEVNKFGQLKKVPFEQRKQAALSRGLLITADHMASGQTPPKPFPDLSQAVIYSGELRGFQERCRATDKNTILRAPTGSGKTESSLFWMQANWRKNSRVFYVLPYTASINAMHRRLSRIFGNENVNVLHGKASAYLYSLLCHDRTSLDAQAQAKALAQLSREMYFPIRICTPHQLLRYALRGRGWEQMLAEFPKACFIFDEIHAYDAQMTGLILGMAKMAQSWDARLLFATATMPDFLKRLLQNTLGISDEDVITPDPNTPSDRAVLDKKRHHVEIWDGNLVSRLDDILQQAEGCPHTLIVCNHVRTAYQVFERCQVQFGQGAVLLHSRFAIQDRNHIEAELLRVLPRILVATQVVEVSLDIDFYQAFFDPAPIDALAQRMGRVNRSGQRAPARIVVMNEQVSTHKLYDSDRTRSTVDALRQVQNPISEDTLIEIANHVYAAGYQGDQLTEFQQAFQHPSLAHLDEHLIAGVHQDWADEIFDEADNQTEILPVFYKPDYRRLIEKGEWLPANSLLIPIRKSIVVGMSKNPKTWRSIDTTDEPWVVHKPYSPETGLRLDADENDIG